MKFKYEIKRMLVKRNSKSVFSDLSKLCKRVVYLLGLFIIYFVFFEKKKHEKFAGLRNNTYLCSEILNKSKIQYYEIPEEPSFVKKRALHLLLELCLKSVELT